MGDGKLLKAADPTTQKEPLLLRGAAARTGDDRLPGAFCSQRDVWIVEGEPIVRTLSPLLELVTKTNIVQEADDESHFATLEMQTKTSAEIEGDDDRFELILLEMQTKTFADTEDDDDE